jgi:Domain of unknown function (DUF5122) beta-propeller
MSPKITSIFSADTRAWLLWCLAVQARGPVGALACTPTAMEDCSPERSKGSSSRIDHTHTRRTLRTRLGIAWALMLEARRTRSNSWRRILVAPAMVIFLIGLSAVGPSVAPAEGLRPVAPSFVFNQSVSQVADDGETTYAAGNFTAEQKPTGGGVIVDASSGEPEFGKLPPVAGEVKAVVPDGSGGWYVGGWFSAIGATPSQNLAHVLSGGSVAAGFAPSINGQVDALAVAGNTLYVGGQFTHIGEETRKHIAAVDTSTGDPTTFAPEADAAVTALLVEGETIYAAGNFTTIAGQSRSNVAALNGNGEATSFTATLSNEHGATTGLVNVLAKSGTTLFVGGSFTSASGKAHALLAGLNATTGEATDFNANVVNEGFGVGVAALVVSGETLYLGGNFTEVGGQSRVMGASVNAATGAVTSWNPELGVTLETEYYAIDRLAVNGSSVFLAGSYYGFAGGAGWKTILVADSASTGKKTSWNPQVGTYSSGAEPIAALATSGEEVLIGGRFAGAGKATGSASYLARILPDGSVDMSWLPPVDGPVSNIAVGPSAVYVYTEGQLVAFNKTTGAPTAFLAGATPNRVYDMVAVEDRLEVAGEFSAPTRSIAEFDGATGTVSSWNPVIGGSPFHVVSRLATSGDTLVIGGQFEEIDGAPRQGIAAFNLATHELTPLSTVCCSAGLESLAVRDANTYFSGSFSAYFSAEDLPESYRQSAAAVETTTGALTGWKPERQLVALSAGASGVYGIDYEGEGFAVHTALVKTNATTGEAEQVATAPSATTLDATGTVVLGGMMIAVGNTVTGPVARFSVEGERREEEHETEEAQSGGEESKEAAENAGSTLALNGGSNGSINFPTTSSELLPPPVLGQSQSVGVTAGSVTVRVKGTGKFVPLSGTTVLPNGSEVDATRGRVRITVATSTPGETQSAEVYGGRFRIQQGRAHGGETRLILSLPLTGCARVRLPHGSAAVVASAARNHRSRHHRSGPRSRHLWVAENGGSWGTNGRYLSTTVEGTHWLTLDRCNRSEVKVTAGKVKVRNLVRHKTKTITAGKSYVARRR